MTDATNFGHPSSWVPQLFFDLIGRVIPGSVLLVLFFAASEAVTVQDFGHVPAEKLKPILSFNIVLLILILGIPASYIFSTLLWGIWISIWSTIKTLGKCSFDPETLVNMEPAVFARRYEIIKSEDPVAGGRATKLKAEIHMSATFLSGLIILTAWTFCAVGDPVWYALSLLGAWGAVGSLVHFRRRINDILNHHPAMEQSDGPMTWSFESTTDGWRW